MHADTDTLPAAASAAERLELSRMLAGDQEALRLLYRRYQRPVYWAAASVLRSRHDAEEVLQDAFILLWEKRARLEFTGDSALGWLLATARYLALNRRRAEARHPGLSIDAVDAAASVADSGQSPEDAAIAAESQAYISAALAQLGAADRAIFALCVEEDLSYQQAADRLGLSHGSVRNRLSRLKNRLRGTLQQQEES